MQTFYGGAQANLPQEILFSASSAAAWRSGHLGPVWMPPPYKAAHTICRQILPCRPSSAAAPHSTLRHCPHLLLSLSRSHSQACRLLGSQAVSPWPPMSTCSGRSSSSRAPCLSASWACPTRQGPSQHLPVCQFPFLLSLAEMPGLWIYVLASLTGASASMSIIPSFSGTVWRAWLEAQGTCSGWEVVSVGSSQGDVWRADLCSSLVLLITNGELLPPLLPSFHPLPDVECPMMWSRCRIHHGSWRR